MIALEPVQRIRDARTAGDAAQLRNTLLDAFADFGQRSTDLLSARDFASHPAYVHPGYGSSVKRGPTRPLIPLKEKLRDQRVPVYGTEDLGALDHDLTRNAVRNGEPIGERRGALAVAAAELTVLAEPRREPSTWLWVRVTFVMLATAWIVARFLGA